MYLIERTTRALAFAAGDLRRQSGLPWFTTTVRKHLISGGEACEAVSTAQYGDVGLHRDTGYFTNLTIPGAMKHAWLHTHDLATSKGLAGAQIVEATSDGVTCGSAVMPYMSDYAVLLRPRGVTPDQRAGACLKANGIIGAEYDTNFHFDIEEQLKYYDEANLVDRTEAIASLRSSEAALQRWHTGFSCSEAVAYAWWHCRKELSLYRHSFLGREVILPVNFMHQNFEIVWCSASWTVDAARSQGLNEEGLDMLSCWKN